MNLTGKPVRHRMGTPPRDPAHIARVKALPCIICGAPGPSDAHHVIHDRATVPKNDRRVLPMCKPCHQTGPNAIHAGTKAWKRAHGNDFDYLARVADMLEGDATP